MLEPRAPRSFVMSDSPLGHADAVGRPEDFRSRGALVARAVMGAEASAAVGTQVDEV
jgi:hypothetical protein